MTAYNTELQDSIMSACLSIHQCTEIKSPELITIEQAYSIDAVITFLKAHLIKVSEFVGAKNKLSDWQLYTLCQQMYNKLPTLTMSEFILFCARIRTGWYGKFYGSIDPQLIFQFFMSFLEDRKHDYILWKQHVMLEEENNKKVNSKPCTKEEFNKMIEDGELPFIRKFLESKYHRRGKQIDFLESIINLTKFKRNNS